MNAEKEQHLKGLLKYRDECLKFLDDLVTWGSLSLEVRKKVYLSVRWRISLNGPQAAAAVAEAGAAVS